MLVSALAMAVAGALALPRPAAAKISKDFTYTYGVVWSTAIRLIRADKGYEITDKDKANGYVLFIYPGSGSVEKCAASMELFRVKAQDGTQRVRVQLTIAHQPSYVALHLLDTLETKLRQERGEPPRPRKKPDDERPGQPDDGKKDKSDSDKS
jgi:hypothetical protein